MGNVLVLHTTEGSTFGGAKATLLKKNSVSHWLHDPDTDEFEELANPDRPARSLRNMSGGVQTNARGGVLQIEIVGRAEDVPGYSDVWYQRLANRVLWICETHDVPKKFPFKFMGSNAYGLRGVARVTGQAWLAAEGIIGHQHVPENTHWDPGKIDIKLKPLVVGGTYEGTDDVAAVKELTERVQRAIVAAGINIGSFGPNDDGVDGDWGDATEAGWVELLDRAASGAGGSEAERVLATIRTLVSAD